MKKNLFGFLLAIAIFLTSSQFVTAQEKPNPVLIDSFNYSNSEDASLRIDRWRNELNQTPQNAGLIIIYGGQTVKRGEVEAHIRGIKQAFRLKGIDEKTIKILHGGFREKLTVDFWIIPAGSNSPSPTPTVDVKKVRVKGVSKKVIPYECCF